MFVKIIKSYRDSEMNLTLVPKTVILEVTEERADKLIKAGVAEEYIFSIPKTEITENVVSEQEIPENGEKYKTETIVDMKPVEIVVNTKKGEIKKNK